mgnify:CR=1 FL=1
MRKNTTSIWRICSSPSIYTSTTTSKSRTSGIEDCYRVFEGISSLKDTERESFIGLIKDESVKKIITNQKISADVKIAYVNALSSLKKLEFKDFQRKKIKNGLFMLETKDSKTTNPDFQEITEEFLQEISDFRPIQQKNYNLERTLDLKTSVGS